MAEPRGDAVSSEGIAALLAVARQQINEGKPSLALKAVVTALRARGGEEAVMQALARARELYLNGVRANAATDELAALFAECALADSSRSQPPQLDVAMDLAPQAHPQPVPPSEHPILAESGRLQVVQDASADGSSFVCIQCGGLVSNLRRDEHLAFWCTPAAP